MDSLDDPINLFLCHIYRLTFCLVIPLVIVGVGGLEPPTPASQTRVRCQLRYTPVKIV